MHVRRGHTDHLRVCAVDWQPQDVERGALRAFVWSPVKRWIDDDVASRPRGIDAFTDLDDLAGSIRPQNDRQLDARVLSLANPDVAPIQRGGMEADDYLARPGMRIWTLFDSKVVGITKGVEDDGAHNGVLYGWSA